MITKLSGNNLLVDNFGLGNAIGVIENGELTNFLIDPKNEETFYVPDTILIAKIERRISNKGSYFVGLPNKKKGFLLSKKNYQLGQLAIVIAKSYHELGKPQKFSDKLKVTSKYFIVTEGRKEIFFSKKSNICNFSSELHNFLKNELHKHSHENSVIVRGQAQHTNEKKLKTEFKRVLDKFLSIKVKKVMKEEIVFRAPLSLERFCQDYDLEKFKVIQKNGIFESHGIWESVQEYNSGRIEIGNFSYLIYEQTAAIFSVDVNSGNDSKVSNGELNLLACRYIVRIIRILGIGGKIVIDFIPSDVSFKFKIKNELINFFESDPIKTMVYGWTKMGNFEIERARYKVPLSKII